jgi:putative hydrolase of the HAD superfamily
MLFIFDMDNVLYRYDWRARMHGLTDMTGHDFHELRRRWWHDEGEWAAEAGNPPTGDEYLAAVNQALGSSIDLPRWLDNRRAAMEVWPDMVDLAQKTASLGTITVLTNNGALIGEHLPDIAPELTPVFGTHLYATAHYGARKPDPTVFSRVLDAYGVEARDTFFIDDMPDNIRGAQTLGISGMVFGPGQSASDAWKAITDFATGSSLSTG